MALRRRPRRCGPELGSAYDRELTRAIEARIRRIAGPASIVIDVNAVDINTFHPLGGAPFGAVCDDAGRVHGQPGLYVVDGAKISGSTGACNPSMTIAALAEYGAIGSSHATWIACSD